MALMFVLFCAMPSVSQAKVSATQSEAIKALKNENWTKAQALVSQANDPMLTKIYYWYFFQEDKTGAYFTPLSQFIRNNKHWPRMSVIKKRFEETMPSTMTPQQVSAWFNDFAPVTPKGMMRYVDALLTQGQTAKAQKVLRPWWEKTLLKPEDQRMIYNSTGKLLTKSNHIARLNLLLSKDYFTGARAVASILGADYQRLTEARIALAKQASDVNQRIAAVPASLQNDSGLLFERLRWRRKNKDNKGAMEILERAPTAKYMHNPKSWWNERHIIARRLMEQGQYKTAYVLVNAHKQKEGFPHSQAEFVSGWLALRFVNDPARAKMHFQDLYNNVETPISKARGAYWTGRALAAQGDKQGANSWYRRAAKYQTTFYGQLAAEQVGIKSALPSAAPPVLSAAEKSRMEKNELIQVATMMQGAGQNKDALTFLSAFIDDHDNAKSYRFAAEHAIKIGNVAGAVYAAKRASRDGMFLTAEGYPLMINSLQGIPIEWALVHGIIRQESVFNQYAISPAGARGLMQLMPATAKETAGKIGLRYSRSRLTSDPNYNIKLGSAYLEKLVARFDNSYPLAAAGYNAGPNRIDRWVRTYGDPRTGEIDLIDWIELIPIYETRNYVQRVMEAVYAYRLRLKGIQPSPRADIHVKMR